MEGNRKATSDRAPAAESPQPEGAATPPGRHRRLGLVLSQRYRIESLIASGGMSDVYRAVDLHLEQAGTKDCFVALKILRSELTQDAGALNLLGREAAKSKRLSHPNIIRVHDLGHDGDTWFMIMELLDGEPLSRIIQRAKPQGLKWKGGKAVLEQVASALAASHRKGIVHADLKPSNIFFTRDGEVKLLDFGVAQALKPHQHVDFLNPRSEDETTIYGYTPAYATPSLIDGGEPTVPDDLYALACISYELLSSRHPFDRRKLTPEEKVAFRVNRPGNMPHGLWRVVRKLLKEDATPVDLAAFQGALEPVFWGRYLYPAGIAASTLMATAFWHLGTERSEAAEARLTAHEQRSEMVMTLGEQPPAELVEALDNLEPMERAGLLKLQEDRLLRFFESRIDDALKSEGRPNLPNVPAALEVLSEARSLYPRDEQLMHRHDQLNQRKLSLESALSNELRARLDQGDYQEPAAWGDLRELAMDYMFLSGQPLELSEKAGNLYQQRLASALASDDGATLAQLLEMADQFLAKTPALNASLTEARNLESAIKALGQYQAAVLAGQQALFPVTAAEQLYGGRFQQWRDTIENAKNSRELNGVYQDMVRYQGQIPSDYKPFSSLREALADAYLARADSLLKQNRTAQAQPLLKRATSLIRSAGNS
ncbi:protein kinase [Marinobacter sp.]|uniref:serine/threonine-protein kinase n=1 Tax=Marinobacter sp. TaxID=50741 RepID=UPI00384ADFB7